MAKAKTAKKDEVTNDQEQDAPAESPVPAEDEAPAVIEGEDTPNTRQAAEEGQGPAISATVVDVKGNPARTYTKAEHGDGFRKLAEEFASKREGWTVR